MSNLDRRPTARELGGLEATSAGPALNLLPGKEVLLGESTRVRRLLPTLGRRMVGAWAFVDHYGPDDVADGAGMQVAPHPHTCRPCRGCWKARCTTAIRSAATSSSVRGSSP
jgi:hypothetical protein